MRGGPPALQILISRVLPLADPSAHNSDPSAVNCIDAGIADGRNPRDVAAVHRDDAEPPLGRAAGDDAVAVADHAHAIAVERRAARDRPADRRRRSVNAIHWPSRENTGLDAVIGVRPVTGRWVFLSSDAIQICPPRVNAIGLRSLDSVKLRGVGEAARTCAPASPTAGDTVHSTPSFENRISFGRHPRERGDVRRPDVGIDREIGQRDRLLAGRDDEEILLPPGVPEKRHHLAVGRPGRRRRVLDLRDAIDRDAAARRFGRGRDGEREAHEGASDK